MFDWYHAFLPAVFLLWLGSTEADRRALRIILAATVASELIVEFGTRGIHGAWKLVIPGALETATILCLLAYARSRTGFLQAACVSVAWLAHAICFADIQLGTDFVYSRYEAILAIVAFTQLAVCHDTYCHHLHRLGHWWRHLVGSGGRGSIPAPSGAAPLLHDPRHARVQPIPPCQTISART